MMLVKFVHPFLIILLSIYLFKPLAVAVTSSKGLKEEEFIDQFLLKLSVEERYLLEYFFRQVFVHGSFGYVLIGAKPVAIQECILKTSIPVIRNSRQPARKMKSLLSYFGKEPSVFGSSMEVWKKYEHHFHLKNFSFQYQDSINLISKMGTRTVILINKKMLETLVEKETYLFREIFSGWKRGRDFVEYCLQNEAIMRKILDNDECLGICLGYGKKNAHSFSKMVDLMRKLGINSMSIHQFRPEKFRELENELHTLEKQLQFSIHHLSRSDVDYINAIGFRCDPFDEETMLLLQNYLESRRALTEYFHGKPFLKSALLLLMRADQCPDFSPGL